MEYAWIVLGIISVVVFGVAFSALSNPYIVIVFIVAIILLIVAIADFMGKPETKKKK